MVRLSIVVSACFLFVVGCGSSQKDPDARPTTYEEAMTLGKEALAENRLAQAADHFASARKFQDSEDARFHEHVARGRIAEERGAGVEALEHYDAALAIRQEPGVKASFDALFAKVSAEAPAPEIDLDEPAAGAVVDTGQVTVAGKVAPGEGTKVRIHGSEVPVTNGAFRATVSSLAPGENEIAVVAERLGKKTETTVRVTVKLRGPSITIQSPPDGTWVSTPEIEVRGRVGDPKAEVSVAGVAAAVAGDGSFSARAPLPQEGANELLVKATVSGGEAGIHRLRVHRDSAPPVLSIVEPRANAIVPAETIQVVVEVADRGELARVTIGEREVTVRDGRARIELPMTNDWMTIRAHAVDRAGHEASAEVYVLKRPVPKGWEYVGVNAAGHHEVRNPVDGGVFIWIAPGPFDRGSEDGDDNEKPRGRIELSGYLIAKTPVTWGQYARFCQATGRSAPTRPSGAKDDHPVVFVNWQDAAAYAQWAGCRLPTEAQWEKAAGWDEKAGASRRYPWGEHGPDQGGRHYANYDPGRPADDGFEATAPVSEYPHGASPCGALQMAGNVSEWCQDWYNPSYYVASPERDPTGPETGIERVIRGGSFASEWEGELRCTARRSTRPDIRDNNLGFRLAKPLSEF